MIGKLQANPKTREYLKDPNFVKSLQVLGSDPSKFFEYSAKDPRLQEALQIMIGGDMDPTMFTDMGDTK